MNHEYIVLLRRLTNKFPRIERKEIEPLNDKMNHYVKEIEKQILNDANIGKRFLYANYAELEIEFHRTDTRIQNHLKELYSKGLDNSNSKSYSNIYDFGNCIMETIMLLDKLKQTYFDDQSTIIRSKLKSKISTQKYIEKTKRLPERILKQVTSMINSVLHLYDEEIEIAKYNSKGLAKYYEVKKEGNLNLFKESNSYELLMDIPDFHREGLRADDYEKNKETIRLIIASNFPNEGQLGGKMDLVDFVYSGGINFLKREHETKLIEFIFYVKLLAEIETRISTISKPPPKEKLSYAKLFRNPDHADEIKEILKIRGYLDSKNEWIGLTDGNASDIVVVYRVLIPLLNPNIKIKHTTLAKIFYKEFGKKVGTEKDPDKYISVRSLTHEPTNHKLKEFHDVFSNILPTEK